MRTGTHDDRPQVASDTSIPPAAANTDPAGRECTEVCSSPVGARWHQDLGFGRRAASGLSNSAPRNRRPSARDGGWGSAARPWRRCAAWRTRVRSEARRFRTPVVVGPSGNTSRVVPHPAALPERSQDAKGVGISKTPAQHRDRLPIALLLPQAASLPVPDLRAASVPCPPPLRLAFAPSRVRRPLAYVPLPRHAAADPPPYSRRTLPRRTPKRGRPQRGRRIFFSRLSFPSKTGSEYR